MKAFGFLGKLRPVMARRREITLTTCRMVGVYCAALVASMALAQQPKKFDKGKQLDTIDGPLSLVRVKAVQKDLKLTTKQVQQIQGMEKVVDARLKADRNKFLGGQPGGNTITYEGAIQVRRQAEWSGINAILTADQRARFTQIRWQQQGPLVLYQIPGSYSGQVDLEPDFVKALDLSQEQQKSILAIMRFDGAKSPAWKDLSENVVRVLTPEQRTKWKDALGEAFKP